ncbi:MAG: 4Fe-4S binding protein [Dehalococcoidaceae bacterium]|nr:4Fe-4S binding protein [Dehalococcoidaceae bacterium]
MAEKIRRKIIRIDEEKCDGCGACVPSCAEGALQIIDGKARLVSEVYCDGLGACLGECPRGAITIEERVAAEFDEQAVKNHLSKEEGTEPQPVGCPSALMKLFDKQAAPAVEPAESSSMLTHWPVQLALVPPAASFLNDADILLAADCAPFAYSNFHRDFIHNRAVLVACPKLDDYDAHFKKLTDILRQSSPKSITVVKMEVPCCSGLTYMVKKAMALAGKNLPLKEITISARGQIVPGN